MKRFAIGALIMLAGCGAAQHPRDTAQSVLSLVAHAVTAVYQESQLPFEQAQEAHCIPPATMAECREAMAPWQALDEALNATVAALIFTQAALDDGDTDPAKVVACGLASFARVERAVSRLGLDIPIAHEAAEAVRALGFTEAQCASERSR